VFAIRRAQPSTLGVRYNAADKSYTLTFPSAVWTYGVQTFGPGEIQPGVDPDLTYYRHVILSPDGLRREYDRLYLTRNSLSTTSYVGAGLAIRAFQTASNRDVTVTPFSYGIPTLDPAVPRAGSAHFDVSLLGGYAHDSLPPTCSCDVDGYYVGRLSGTGGIDVNFATGVIGMTGTAQEYDRATGLAGAAEPFGGTAALAALTNNFSGTFTYGSTAVFNGNWLGRFYGPAAIEIGGTFYATRNTANGNEAVIGAITGKQSVVSTIGAAGMPFTYSDYGGWYASIVPSAGGILFPGPAGSIAPAADAVSRIRDIPEAARGNPRGGRDFPAAQE